VIHSFQCGARSAAGRAKTMTRRHRYRRRPDPRRAPRERGRLAAGRFSGSSPFTSRQPGCGVRRSADTRDPRRWTIAATRTSRATPSGGPLTSRFTPRARSCGSTRPSSGDERPASARTPQGVGPSDVEAHGAPTGEQNDDHSTRSARQREERARGEPARGRRATRGTAKAARRRSLAALARRERRGRPQPRRRNSPSEAATSADDSRRLGSGCRRLVSPPDPSPERRPARHCSAGAFRVGARRADRRAER
jgi:hypothetical protein